MSAQEILADLMRKANEKPAKNVKEKVGRKHSRAARSVITPLGEFRSITAAARAHELAPATIHERLTTKREQYYYTDRKLVNDPLVLKRKAFKTSIIKAAAPFIAAGMTHQEIAIELNKLGIKMLRGNEWSQRSVSRILRKLWGT